MVVVTLSGVASVGGMVTWGRTGWIFAVTKTSLTSDVTMELLPTPSSPQTQIRTGGCQLPIGGARTRTRTGGHAGYTWFRKTCCVHGQQVVQADA